MSSREARSDVRARIARAATDLIASGGRVAVTTRAVSNAAGVQPPTIYRHFGDMQGLLDVVARETIAVHMRDQAIRAPTNDPVEDLRRGWDLYVEFGLAHPDAFALLYAAPSIPASVSAIDAGVAVLEGLVTRIAEAGRLRFDVRHATELMHAAGTGLVISLAATAPGERDPRLSETMRETMLSTISVSAPADARDRKPDPAPTDERVAVHSVALRATPGRGSQRPVACRAAPARRLARPTGDGWETWSHRGIVMAGIDDGVSSRANAIGRMEEPPREHPVILAPDDDGAARRTLSTALVRRFGADYDVGVAAGADAAFSELTRLVGDGSDIALVIAAQGMAPEVGRTFLARTRALVPRARRMVPLPVGDFSAVEAIARASTLGEVDYQAFRPSGDTTSDSLQQSLTSSPTGPRKAVVSIRA
jgi:AcrR family transcriptional regulator